jgi:hypothetical protein
MRVSPPYFRALVAYDSFLEPGGIEKTTPGSFIETVARDFSPLRVLPERGKAIPPMLIVRAELDDQVVNEPMDQFVRGRAREERETGAVRTSGGRPRLHILGPSGRRVIDCH